MGPVVSVACAAAGQKEPIAHTHIDHRCRRVLDLVLARATGRVLDRRHLVELVFAHACLDLGVLIVAVLGAISPQGVHRTANPAVAVGTQG